VRRPQCSQIKPIPLSFVCGPAQIGGAAGQPVFQRTARLAATEMFIELDDFRCLLKAKKKVDVAGFATR
jgi:hypothetical protein